MDTGSSPVPRPLPLFRLYLGPIRSSQADIPSHTRWPDPDPVCSVRAYGPSGSSRRNEAVTSLMALRPIRALSTLWPLHPDNAIQPRRAFRALWPRDSTSAL